MKKFLLLFLFIPAVAFGGKSSVDFDGGTGDLIDLGTFSVVSSGFTMMCWFNIDSFTLTRDDRFISKADGIFDSNHDWMLGTRGTGTDHTLRTRINRTAATTFGGTTLGTLTGQWHHAAVTFNNGTVLLYLDGAQDGAGAHNSGSLPNNSDSVYIGNQPTAALSSPDGKLADVRIYSRVLTPLEIQIAIRCLNMPADTRNHWPLLEEGTSFVDIQGKQNGTGTGTADSAIGPPTTWCAESN